MQLQAYLQQGAPRRVTGLAIVAADLIIALNAKLIFDQVAG